MILANIFNDNMVLQQNNPLNLFGFISPNEKVSLEVLNTVTKRVYKKSTVANNDGYFLVEFPSFIGGTEKYIIKALTNDKEQTINNCLFGEVFLTAGQSNMAFGLKLIEGFDKIKNYPKYDDIRFLDVVDVVSDDGFIYRPFEKQNNLKFSRWTDAFKTDDFENTSAIAYLTAYYLRQKIGVPIGLINTAVGGSSIDSWLDYKLLNNLTHIKEYLISIDKWASQDNYHSLGILNYTVPSGIYNEKIAPLKNFNISGVWWYQGENSVNDQTSADIYYECLKLLIKQFRKDFNDFDLPFYAVQIALNYYPHASQWSVAMINEAINLATKESNNSFNIPIHDIVPNWLIPDGQDYHNPIHPISKEPVARRLAKVIYENQVNKRDITLSVKAYRCYKNYIDLEINNPSFELQTLDNRPITGFCIAADDLVYHKAEAKIMDNKTIRVFSRYVKDPLHLSYGFYLYNTDANICSSELMPLGVFRTNREVKSKYYSVSRYLSCDFLEEFVANFFHIFGVTGFKPCYQKGNLNSTNEVVINLNDSVKSEGTSSLEIKYKPNLETMNYIGVSPIVDYIGHHHHFENFRFLSVDISNPDDWDKVFVGLLAQTLNNEIILLPVIIEHELSYQTTLKRKSDFTRYTISLEKAFRSDMSIIPTNYELLKNIKKIQFTFKDNQEGLIRIDNIELHNSIIEKEVSK